MTLHNPRHDYRSLARTYLILRKWAAHVIGPEVIKTRFAIARRYTLHALADGDAKTFVDRFVVGILSKSTTP